MFVNKKGFTLIELLVVISIITLLSSIVLVALKDVGVRARDAKRSADIQQIVAALLSYSFQNNGSFPSSDNCVIDWCCLGHGNQGLCFASLGLKGDDTLDNSLSPLYLPKIPDDPLNNTSRYGDSYVYNSLRFTGYVSLNWGIEKNNPTSKDCNGGSPGNWGPNKGNGFNNYCDLNIPIK